MTKTIALFLHQPKCSVQSGNGIIKALHPHYKFKIFTKHELEDDFFDDVDMVLFPGGVGDADSWDSLLKFHKSRIQDFVAKGGRYLGICMGAYWADNTYFGLSSDFKVDQYITRPNTDTKRPHAKQMKVTWDDKPEELFFYDGCAIFGNESKYDVVARYPNGDAMAIIQNRIGLIGCHPEAEQHWYDEYSWMRKRWNGSKHHLLLDFVDNLMRK
jgi:glutamine amidotransferase-like uncharacterized protein